MNSFQSHKNINTREPRQGNHALILQGSVGLAVLYILARPVFSIVAALCIILSAAPASAQLGSSELRGTVQDSTMAVLSGAEVTATQNGTGYKETVATDSAGLFDFKTLPVGTYTLSVTSPGFSAYSQTGIVLNVGQHRELSIGLQIGQATQELTVSAAAVSIDPTSPTEQSTIEQKVITDLPLNGRNPATLTFTVAGVVDAGLNISSAITNSTVKPGDAVGPQEIAPAVHGARPGGTYFSLDGANNTDPFSVIGEPFPNPDATGEFSVVTGTYGAQYVSAPGGAINIVTRAGTNRVHGTAFEFIRNGYFNARNFYSNQPDILKRNQYGVAVGAPLVHDKLFIFGTYQGTPVRNSTTAIESFPTAAQRSGNFGTFQIPSSMLDPTTQKILQYLPVGDPTTGLASYQTPGNNNDQQGLVKLDWNLGQHRIFARAFYDRYVIEGTANFGSSGLAASAPGYTQPFESFAIGDTWSPGKWTFQTTASYLRQLSDTTVPKNPLSYSNLGLNNLSGYSGNPALYFLYVVGAFAAGPGSVAQYPRESWEVSHNAFVTKGKHQISMGFNYRHIGVQENNYQGENPVLIYVGVNSYIDGLYGIIPGATLNPTADFILGAPYEYIQGDGSFTHVKGNLFGLYAEDNIRLTNKLTATLGLRWDPSLPYTPDGNRITCFSPGAQSKVFTGAFPGVLFPGDTGCPTGGYSQRLNQFEPRVGLAYQANSKTAVRAGYGLYDLQVPLETYAGFSAQPWVRTYALIQPGLKLGNVWASAGKTDPFASGFQLANYSPTPNVTFTPGLAASTFDKNFRPAYVQQWSLSLQQLFSTKDSIDVAYVGTQGTHLSMGVSANTPVYGPGASTTNEQARRPYTNYGNITSLNSIGTSSYNGVDLTYRHRDSLYSVTSAFTWSKSIDDLSQPAVAGTINIPNYNHSFFRGRSSYYQPLSFRNTVTLNGPTLSKFNSATRYALGSWEFSGLAVVDSGQTFSVFDSSDLSYTGLSLDLADRVPGVPLYVNRQLNLQAFKDNAPGTFGNSGRNAYRGPAYRDVDIAMIKTFPVKGDFAFTFRAEAFDVLNHPNFVTGPQGHTYQAPGTSGAANFSKFLTARDPRIMQFSLKAAF